MNNIILSFGKHRGKNIKDVPASYLLWLYEQTWFTNVKFPEIYNYIVKHKKELHTAEFSAEAWWDFFEDG